MATQAKVNWRGQGVLLVTFSPEARVRLEDEIRQIGLKVIGIDGRAPEAAESLREYAGAVVVVDSSAADVSLTQTVREVGRVRPECLVLAVRQDSETVSAYRGGRSVGTVENLKVALLNQTGALET